MAKALQNSTPTLLIKSLTIILSLISLARADNEHHDFSKTLSPKELGLKKEKLTHLHFYFHDIVNGENATVVRVASAESTNSSKTSFGLVAVIDDLLTVGPEPTSRQVGRAQGIYASASQSEVGLLMVQNYVFTEGKYNGSTLSVLGRNAAFSAVRELAIVGGSGLFRFARGYAQARTHSLNITSGVGVIEYNVYVYHY